MLAKRIKELRVARKMNQIQLGAALSVTKQTISNWENDNIQPSINMLVKIAKYFGVSCDYLLGIDDTKYINVDGLTDEQASHIRMIVEDIKKK